MEFTEVQELNNLTSHARTFQSKQFIPEYNESTLNYRGKPSQPTPDPLLDYERALEDTPPASPSKHLALQKGLAPELINEGIEESIEDLLGVIQNCLVEIDASANIPVISIKPLSQPTETTQETAKIEETEENKEIEEKGEDNENKEENEEKDENEEKEEKEENEKEDRVGELNTIFGKIGGHDISKTYQETKNIKSFLSNSIKAFPMSRTDYAPAKRGETKTFRVYFCTREHSTIIPLSLTQPIMEIIKHCLENFKLNKVINDLIKYADRPDAYDLKKDLESTPFDRSKTLKEYKLSQELTLCECENFDPSKPLNKAKDNNKDKSALINITLLLPTEDRTKFSFQMAPDRQVKDIFHRLALDGKMGYTIQAYNLRVYSSDMEARFRDSKNFLDANIPIRSIKNADKDEIIQLELVKKKFADEPNDPPIDSRNISPKKRAGTLEILPPDQDEHQIILYNDVSANQYEEFEVTKINESNKRQLRILGIDGFKLYNYSKSYKQEQAGGIGEMFNALFFSKFGVMNPERLLTDVVEAQVVSGNLFKICIRSEGKEKWTSFEAADPKTASQIVAKLKYLKASHEKKRGN